MAVYTEEDGEVKIPLDAIVSMNCWGFTPDIFDKVNEGFKKFLAENNGDIKREYYLPFAVKEIMERGDCSVRVYSSTDPWYGVTYREDRDFVVSSLARLKSDGTYPNKLNEKLK